MENKIKQKAIEDVKYIKEIIDKTSSSMLTLSSLFLKCGILFLGVCIVLILGSRIPVPSGSVRNIYGMLLQIISFISLPIIVIVPILIFKKLVKINPLKGVSKQIMIFWTFIIMFILICFLTISLSRIILTFFNPFHVSAADNIIPYLFSIHLFLFAFGLFCIYIFTSFKFPLILGSVYTFIGLYLMILQLPWNIFDILLMPITFLAIGIYFKLLQVKVI